KRVKERGQGHAGVCFEACFYHRARAQTKGRRACGGYIALYFLATTLDSRDVTTRMNTTLRQATGGMPRLFLRHLSASTSTRRLLSPSERSPSRDVLLLRLRL